MGDGIIITYFEKKCESFFVAMFTFEAFEKVTMGPEAVFTSNWVFEEKSLEWFQSEGHVAAEENK